MASNVPDKNEVGEFALKSTKVLGGAALKEGIKYAIERNNPATKIGGFAGAGVSAVVEIGLMGGEQILKAREKSKAEKKPERKEELIRRYDSTVKFKNSEFAGGDAPYIVIDGEPRHLRPDAEEKISIHDVKREGLYGNYSYKDSNPVLLDKLSKGELNSHFLGVKLIEYAPKEKTHNTQSVWLKKILQDLPSDPNIKLIFAHCLKTQTKFQPKLYTLYTEITLYKRTVEGNKRVGMIRLLTPNGVAIFQNSELLHWLSAQTEQESLRDQERLDELAESNSRAKSLSDGGVIKDSSNEDTKTRGRPRLEDLTDAEVKYVDCHLKWYDPASWPDCCAIL